MKTEKRSKRAAKSGETRAPQRLQNRTLTLTLAPTPTRGKALAPPGSMPGPDSIAQIL